MKSAKTVLGCQEYGSRDAPVLVMLHGFMGSGNSFSAMAKEISQDFRVVCFDLPGHGLSDFSSIPERHYLNDLADVASLILGDLLSLQITRFALYGYSMGGRVAQMVTLAAPEKVFCLILESASFGITDSAQREKRLVWDQNLFSGISSREDFMRFLDQWHDLPLFCTLKKDPDKRILINQKLQNQPVQLQKALDIMSVGRQPETLGRLAQTGIPLWLIIGEKDIKYSLIGKSAKKMFPALGLLTIENASHNVHFACQDEILARIWPLLLSHTPG